MALCRQPSVPGEPGSAKGAHDSTGFGIVTGEVENNMRTQPVLGSFARGATVDTAKRDTQTRETLRGTAVEF